MGCIYSDWNGRCTLCEEGQEYGEATENGNCVVEDDPNPEDSCESYEPDDNYCPDCGNEIEECECDE